MVLHVQTTLEPVGPATAIELTDAQVDDLGGGKRAAVLVTIGARQARLRLAVMGGANLIGLSKAARAQLGVDIGDTVDAAIELDAAARTVQVPDDLAAALAEASLRSAFDAQTYTRRKEGARSVAEAKRPETRLRRIEKVIAELNQGAG
ncbi:YdeI/OmpD-associated family protein [Gordonia sp. CPCC 205333]|uniref:YdeI/OmpD-associated family protein n=1 Tax=Gordonia sp. CPCC 205333 TaxID=3140790 RepID=UPI003AF34B25